MVISTMTKYSIPVAAVLFGMNYESDRYEVADMGKMSFLLNNNVSAPSISTLVENRHGKTGAQNSRFESDQWCSKNSTDNWTITYSPTPSVQSFLVQINYYGYHDLCNYDCRGCNRLDQWPKPDIKGTIERKIQF